MRSDPSQNKKRKSAIARRWSILTLRPDYQCPQDRSDSPCPTLKPKEEMAVSPPHNAPAPSLSQRLARCVSLKILPSPRVSDANDKEIKGSRRLSWLPQASSSSLEGAAHYPLTALSEREAEVEADEDDGEEEEEEGYEDEWSTIRHERLGTSSSTSGSASSSQCSSSLTSSSRSTSGTRRPRPLSSYSYSYTCSSPILPSFGSFSRKRFGGRERQGTTTISSSSSSSSSMASSPPTSPILRSSSTYISEWGPPPRRRWAADDWDGEGEGQDELIAGVGQRAQQEQAQDVFVPLVWSRVEEEGKFQRRGDRESYSAYSSFASSQRSFSASLLGAAAATTAAAEEEVVGGQDHQQAMLPPPPPPPRYTRSELVMDDLPPPWSEEASPPRRYSRISSTWRGTTR